MTGRERLAGIRIMAQVEADRIAPSICARDCIDCAIRLSRFRLDRLVSNCRDLGHRRHCVYAPYVEIVATPADSTDHHIIPVDMFVGQTAIAHPPNQWFAPVTARTPVHPGKSMS